MASRYHLFTTTSARRSGGPEARVGSEPTPMPTVRIDGQGRIVVPLPERRRLGLQGGDELVLLPTPEGLLLERRRAATVRTAADGLPVVDFAEPRRVTNEEAVAAIRAERASR